MLQVKLPVVERIHPQSIKFAMGVENKGTGDSKLNNSPDDNSQLVLNNLPCFRLAFLAEYLQW